MNADASLPLLTGPLFADEGLDREALAKALFGMVITDEKFEEIVASWIRQQLGRARGVNPEQAERDAAGRTGQHEPHGKGLCAVCNGPHRDD